MYEAYFAVRLVSAMSFYAPSPSCILTSKNEDMLSLANGVARDMDLHDQSNYLYSAGSNTMWLVEWNEVERRVVATCLIWPGEEHLPEEVVARPVGNAGSSLLLNVTIFGR
jgi:hypothetical protein